jgi:hypothetical protein
MAAIFFVFPLQSLTHPEDTPSVMLLRSSWFFTFSHHLGWEALLKLPEVVAYPFSQSREREDGCAEFDCNYEAYILLSRVYPEARND